MAAAGLLLLALAAPTALAGTWWIDNRFPLNTDGTFEPSDYPTGREFHNAHPTH
jgi:hypothetical protein